MGVLFRGGAALLAAAIVSFVGCGREEPDASALAQRLVHLSAEKQRTYYGRNDATAAVIDVEALPAAGSC